MGCACATHSAAASPERIDVSDSSPRSPQSGGSSPKDEEDTAFKRSTSRSFHSQYSIDGKLGEGCFARVYACNRNGAREQAGSSIAVKVTDLQGSDSKLQLATHEAAILQRIGSQKNCCRFVDAMSCRRFHYIVMERCDMTLMNALDGAEELNERVLAGFVRQMLQGIRSVHDVGVVHRDIKPDNFMCTQDGTVKLCDFGLSEELGNKKGERVSGVFGTAPFMSPEMISGTTYGRSTDVWSLGVCLYALVTGEFPYTPERPDTVLMRKAIACGVPAPKFECTVPGVQLSAQLLSLMQTLLDRDPKTRPATAGALEHGWFSQGAADENQQPSLKGALHAARQAGAFEAGSRGASRITKPLDRMDWTLLDLQKRYHRSQLQPQSRRSPPVVYNNDSSSPRSRRSPPVVRHDSSSSKATTGSEMSTTATSTSGPTRTRSFSSSATTVTFTSGHNRIVVDDPVTSSKSSATESQGRSGTPGSITTVVMAM